MCKRLPREHRDLRPGVSTRGVAVSSHGAADLKASPLPPAPYDLLSRLTGDMDDLLDRLPADMDPFLKL